MKPFTHYQPTSIEEACRLLKEFNGKARVNAGGTDLITVLHANILNTYPSAIIDLKSIPDMNYIRFDGDTLCIGALTTLDEICRSDVIRNHYSALSDAAQAVASPQIRNVGTIGGNLCQENRCWYYRYPDRLGGGAIHCLRKGKGKCYAPLGDNRYHAIMGVKGCFAVCPSDTAVALSALDASVVVAGPETQYEVPVRDFYHPMGNVLHDDEIIVEIRVPDTCKDVPQGFVKHTQRNAIDFAIASAAAVLKISDGKVIFASLALGAVAPMPVYAYEASQILLNKSITAETLNKTADVALAGAKPLSGNYYKVPLTKNILKKVIRIASDKTQ